MPSLDRIPELTRNRLLTRAVEVHYTAPFVRPTKPLSESRVAIVTSAGLHLRQDDPFVSDDPSYRVIPSGVTQAEILQSHSSLGFDRGAVMQDLNVVFPIDRLRELAAQGAIGELPPHYYSFMGAQEDVSAIKQWSAGEVAKRLVAEGADIVLVTPT